ncbi:Phenylalanyl-tRNA synthetase alpha chain [Candidatus Phytoplasma mali]|uniref:Phenylalanine--tRNA ligase alpha subunit n=1 Tax=Phytoplasma mali (strain AT) TaxID=482235 RepID=B3R0A3_PHYMT|nr:Phenylalanyl-tRNA synthetase alpha chain [Candidatus Phytoplasma mali]
MITPKIQNLNNLLLEIEYKFKKKLEEVKTLDDVINLEIQFLGKKSLIKDFLNHLKNNSLIEKKNFGKKINLLKQKIILALQTIKEKLKQKSYDEINFQKNINVGLPSFFLPCGSIHPLNQVIEQIEDIFLSLGYEIHDGLELEKELYNFDMMNMGKEHPSRAMQDSFYIDEQTLLRTHTSSVQVKSMLARKSQPLKVISSGKVFRRDNDDSNHSHQFMQLEGFVIDKNINLKDLKQHILFFLETFFNKKPEIRIRPSYFPFTEPSIEVDLLVTPKEKPSFYLEILGAGLIHPQVIVNGGYDPLKYQGFAFGIGIERIAMLKYRIEDIRSFYNSDIRFLKQF